MVNPLIYLINLILNIVSFLLIVWIVLSWLISFRIVNPHQQLVYQVNTALNRLFEPMLRPIRRIMPDTGSLDLSPIVLFIAIEVIQYSLVYYF